MGPLFCHHKSYQAFMGYSHDRLQHKFDPLLLLVCMISNFSLIFKDKCICVFTPPLIIIVVITGELKKYTNNISIEKDKITSIYQIYIYIAVDS